MNTFRCATEMPLSFAMMAVYLFDNSELFGIYAYCMRCAECAHIHTHTLAYEPIVYYTYRYVRSNKEAWSIRH